MTRFAKILAGACLAVSLILCVLPMATMALLSFCSGRFPALPWPGWSTRWYVEAVTNTALHLSLTRSVICGLMAAFGALLVGFPVGYALSRSSSVLGRRLILLFTLPALLPYILFGFAFLQLARILCFDRTLLAVVIAHVVSFGPVALGLCYHRCGQLNRDLEHAAHELGASEIHILFSIVASQIWRSLVAAFLLVFVLSWDEYIISWFLSGFEKTYPVYVRNLLESTMSPQVHAIGVLVAVASFIVVGTATHLLGRDEAVVGPSKAAKW